MLFAFLNGDPKNGPQPHIGRRFASPIKKGSDRRARAIGRQHVRRIQELQSASSLESHGSSNSSSRPQTSKSTSSLPQLSTVLDPESTTTEVEPMTVSVGEQLIDNYQVTELPQGRIQGFQRGVHNQRYICIAIPVADPGGFIGFHGNPLSKVKIILIPIFMQQLKTYFVLLHNYS